MEENKIPTAEEFIEDKDNYLLTILSDIGEEDNIKNIMIEFAKMHVKKALESAEHATNTRGIQHCYPLENIK